MQFQTSHSLRCGGSLISLDTPLVMGILNITPDSFYDGGRFDRMESALQQAEKMILEGARILDLGAATSKPGSPLISADEESKRLLPVLKAVVEAFPEILISIDTYNSDTARAAIEKGAHIINDISAGNIDPDMMSTVGEMKVPYIMMHMQGTPETMQNNPQYGHVVEDVKLFFAQKVDEAYAAGITDIVLDPGFGFGKSLRDNFQMLAAFETFKTLNLPLLAGLSRKSMIYKTLDITPQDALNGTTALQSIALYKGAKILRVHDVQEAMECIKLMEALN